MIIFHGKVQQNFKMEELSIIRNVNSYIFIIIDSLSIHSVSKSTMNQRCSTEFKKSAFHDVILEPYNYFYYELKIPLVPRHFSRTNTLIIVVYSIYKYIFDDKAFCSINL